MMRDHAVQLPVAGHGELHTHPEAVQRRIAATHDTQHCQRRRRGTELVLILPGLQDNIIAKPLSLLMGVRVAPHIDQEGRVVHHGALVIGQPHAVGQP
jgi:hypothetical protein